MGCLRISRSALLLPALMWVVGCGGGHGGGARDRTLQDGAGAEYLAHELVVHRPEGVDEAAFTAQIDRLGGRLIADGGPLTKLGYYRVELPADVIADQAISNYLEAGAVDMAERNYVAHAIGTPDDPRYGELWGLAKIGMSSAWDTATGSEEVIVAVTDTGVDRNHPDLAAATWVNTGEVPGNGIDDDGNGYVDDVNGYDFINNDSDPIDDHGHGTHVAGTIGATGDDGRGIVGVNWRVRVMGAKMLAANGSGSLYAGAAAIVYAADNGAHVVNASWGCSGCYTQYVHDAIERLNEQGGLFVAAAGNSGTDNDSRPHYPSSHTNDNVVAVAASDPGDGLASFSCFGATSVDIAAPGTGILSSTPGGGYASWNGTSMATPHVAGAAALYVGHHGEIEPTLLREYLLATAKPFAAFSGRMVSGGRLDVPGLLAAGGEPPPPPTLVSADAGHAGDVVLRWQAPADTEVAYYRVHVGTETGFYTRQERTQGDETEYRMAGLSAGSAHYFAVETVNADGRHGEPSNELSATPVDAIAPAQVVDLAARPLAGAVASGRVVMSSGEFSEFYAAGNAHDGDDQSDWSTPPRAVAQEESLVVELDRTQRVDRVELLPSLTYPDFFPQDFDIEVSVDNHNWETVGGQRGSVAPVDGALTVAFAPIDVRQLRLRVLRAAEHASGFHYVSLAEVRVRKLSETPGHVELSFRAPGDNPGEGSAASYDIRYATTAISADDFEDATPVQDGAPPQVAGRQELRQVTGLQGETDYFFAMRATDAAGNQSLMSNVARTSTLVTPPGAVLDLAVEASHDNRVELAWTAPGGDGASGTADLYDLRYAEVPIDAGNFPLAVAVVGLPHPAVSGSQESFVVDGLTRGKQYYFALRSHDSTGATSGLSNIVSAITDGGADTTPPAQIEPLQIISARREVAVALTAVDASENPELAPRALDGSLYSAWQAYYASADEPAHITFDAGEQQLLSRFRMHPTVFASFEAHYPRDFTLEGSTDGTHWAPLLEVEGLLARSNTWDEWSIEPRYARYLRLRVTRRGPGACGQSGACDNAMVLVGEFEAHAVEPEIAVQLSWVAPGDDGYLGTATTYDLRRGPGPLDDAAWGAATPIVTHVPAPAGALEVLQLEGLGEGAHHFAIVAEDEAGNRGERSREAVYVAPGVPPAAVTDLSASASGGETIDLTWTATGDDGFIGTATAFDLRYDTEPLSAERWENATPVPGVPSPGAAGTLQGVQLAGLASETRYYFAMRVVDDVQQASLGSNMATAVTDDVTPPGAVGDLSASLVEPEQGAALPLTHVADSGSFSPETRAAFAVDGDPDSTWITEGGERDAVHFIELQLAGAQDLGGLSMRAAEGYADLFPEAFALQVRAEPGAPFTDVIRETGFQSAGGDEHWALGSVPAVAVRLRITGSRPFGGSYYAAIAELSLTADNSQYGVVQLAFTAPGEDGGQGQVAGYTLRRADAPIADDGAFDGAIDVPEVPAPLPPGGLQRAVLTGLASDAQHCFSVRAHDAAGNLGARSNSPCVDLPGLPPAVVNDLTGEAVDAASVRLGWTAVGDNGRDGQAAGYDLRFSTERIHTGNWQDATPVDIDAPASAGETESAVVGGLASAMTYHFALRTRDAGGAWSGISNNARVETLDGVAPAPVLDLVAETHLHHTGGLRLTFTAPGDNGPLGQAAVYDLRASTEMITEGNFDAAMPLGSPTPQAAGSLEDYAVSGLDPERLYYVAMRSMDAAGNVSDMGNVSSARTRDESPGAIVDLRVTEAAGQVQGAASLTLAYTHVGDDGDRGQAASYELRYATDPIDAGNFDAAVPVSPAPPTAPAGQAGQWTVSGLDVGARYYLAMAATDERGNRGSLSNVAIGDTPDLVAPAAVTDLTATVGASSGRIDLRWTAPGDDGAVGRAVQYELRHSAVPIHAGNFAAATLAEVSAPGQVGTSESATVAGLPVESPRYFALRAVDDAGNQAPLSNVAMARTADVAPGRTADLRAAGATLDTVELRWTEAGDDGGVGAAAAFELRVSTAAIDADNFEDATELPAPAPTGAGATVGVSASGLLANTAYYFALRTVDERGNRSPLSNLLSTRTADADAPGAVVDLAAATGGAAGSIVLSWTAVGDDGAVGTAKAYQLRTAATPITAATWDAASPVAGAPKPAAAGSGESMTVSGLVGERSHHFALRVVDESDNIGPVSNGASADTPPVAPARVTDLAALAQPGTARLSWTAPGDDGAVGTAVAYDLRYSLLPITVANFDSAAAAPGVPVPQLAGSAEAFALEGLSESTTYHFALRTRDDTGTWSALSNIASVTTPDLSAPGAPWGVSAVAPPSEGPRVPVGSASASSELDLKWAAGHVLDDDDNSSWASAAAALPEAQDLTLQLSSEVLIDRIVMRADPALPHLFPRGFELQVSGDGSSFATVASEANFDASEGGSGDMVWGFSPVPASHVRVHVTDSAESYGKYYAVVSAVEVYGARPTEGSALVSWLAPGDDGVTGRADHYEMYMHDAPFDAGSLAGTTPVADLPPPATAGALQSVELRGLPGEHALYWALRAVDEAGNVGPLSEVVSMTTGDVAPAAVNDLSAVAEGTSRVRVAWTATGDDGLIGRAQRFELRYARFSLTSHNFVLATEVGSLPVPGPSGSAHELVVDGLDAGSTYRFAVVVEDAAGNRSYLSNVALASTAEGPDLTAPAAVADLTALPPTPAGQAVALVAHDASGIQSGTFDSARVVDGSPDSGWVSEGSDDDGEAWIAVALQQPLDAGRVRVQPLTSLPALFPPAYELRVSPDGLSWMTIASAVDYLATPGDSIVADFDPALLGGTPVNFVELRARSLGGDGPYYAAVGEIAVETAGQAAGTGRLSWVAPGDDGWDGSAAEYDLRWGTCPLDFDAATPLVLDPPLPSGVAERYRVTGLPAGAHCVGLRSGDEVGNWSATSNVAVIDIP